MYTSWHTKTVAQLLQEFSTRESGLTKEEAIKLERLNGLNELPSAKRPSLFSLFFAQFNSPLIYLLLVASVITFFLN